MPTRILVLIGLFAMSTFAQPAIEPGVSHELAKWRAAHYSDIRYKLNLTLEKMAPVLKGSIEIRVKVVDAAKAGRGEAARSGPGTVAALSSTPIILDWRKIMGHEGKSQVSNVSINAQQAESSSSSDPKGEDYDPDVRSNSVRETRVGYAWENEHLIFRDGVVVGENVIKLDFTSPILTSGSAITRYVDKEDGSEYIYSLFVPSDASTAFPVFDQPDLKARFRVSVTKPSEWAVVTNTPTYWVLDTTSGFETQPISTYVFAFAAGPFEKFNPDSLEAGLPAKPANVNGRASPPLNGSVFVRKSQAAKFKSHAAEVFRLNREAVKYFEEYFDYKFPFPKYDLVLIPEFPFGGMEHAGATFLRESSIIFPQEPTKNDHINRATLIFHEASHQWFGDTVTMRWFDDLWLKEGFATFTAYKAMEKIMPEMNAWKVFYERVKQAAYQTDSTKGTTPIYQEIPNLSAAKSAYGNIVYNKAPAFLRQAEFYLGEDKFQTAVRAFLKKHEFGNAGWEDLVREFEAASKQKLTEWARQWVTQRGMPIFESRVTFPEKNRVVVLFTPRDMLKEGRVWSLGTQWVIYPMSSYPHRMQIHAARDSMGPMEIRTGSDDADFDFGYFFPNYGDYGYGIFLLDLKSRDYVLKNIQNEKDPFLRSMMWGALWDSVREGELDPKQYVELVVKVLSPGFSRPVASKRPPEGGTQNADDESTVALLLNRVSTAMNYYLSEPGAVATGLRQTSTEKMPVATGLRNAPGGKRPVATAPGSDLRSRVEDMLIERMRSAETLGQRITFYRAFLNVAASDKARGVLKAMLKSEPSPSVVGKSDPRENHPVGETPPPLLRKEGSQKAADLPLKSKDRFDIVTRLIILGDPDGLKLLADLEKTEASDDARRWAYAAKAGVPTAESKAKYWNDFVSNKEISESWIEAAFGPWNSIRHERLTLPYLERALKELPNHKRSRKIFFVNGWLGAFIGGQRSEEALAIVNKFLADNPSLDRDLRLKVLENVDVIERAVKIRQKF